MRRLKLQMKKVGVFSAFVACFALTSQGGDSFTWKGGEGAWDEASNWLLGGGGYI